MNATLVGGLTVGDLISVPTDKKVQFRDTAIYIYSGADGYLDLVADGAVRIANQLIISGGDGAGLNDSPLIVRGGYTTNYPNVFWQTKDTDGTWRNAGNIALKVTNSSPANYDAQMLFYTSRLGTNTLQMTLTSTGQLQLLGGSTAGIQIRDSGIAIRSDADSYLDLVADGAVRVTSPIDIQGGDTKRLVVGATANYARLHVQGYSSYHIGDLRLNHYFNGATEIYDLATQYGLITRMFAGTTQAGSYWSWLISSSAGGGTYSDVMKLTGAGQLQLLATTDSSSKDTGAIICEGGIGIEKNCYIGVDLHVIGQVYTPNMSVSDLFNDLEVIRGIRSTPDGLIDPSSLPEWFRTKEGSINLIRIVTLCLGALKQLSRGVAS